MDSRKKQVTPAYVSELSKCEIFVFGSNLEGRHRGGAARTAYEKFGAEWGVGNGPTGKCYAIPTMHGGVKEIKPYVDKFIQYAKDNPMKRFLVTRVGCGIAGFKDEEIAPLFLEGMRIPNVSLPQEWITAYLRLRMDKKIKVNKFNRPEPPKVVSEEILHELAQKYVYPISVELYTHVPDVKIRYVKDRGEFGYTTLSNCFFFDDGGMYVWDSDERWREEHNQDLVELTYGDECYGRGYAHRVFFAGVATGIKDYVGEMIYTGDVLQIDDEIGDSIYALGTLNDNYAFILDNCALLLSDCIDKKLKRVGTVFYQLDKSETPVRSLNDRTKMFQGPYDTNETRELKKLMARFTPNFDQEIWKYKALDVLEIEFNWNK